MSSTPDEPPRRGRGRPRTPGAEKRIIDAALEEYGEHGWSGFTMDGVARRAGVGKSTVYLRWQDKDSLLTDAVSTASSALGAVNTGSLRGDLHALAVNLYQHYRDPAGWASLRIIIDSAGAPQRLGRFSEDVGDVQVEYVEQMLARAVERGEITPHVAPGSLAECMYGSVMMQSLGLRLESKTLTDEDIQERSDQLVDLVLNGLHS